MARKASTTKPTSDVAKKAKKSITKPAPKVAKTAASIAPTLSRKSSVTPIAPALSKKSSVAPVAANLSRKSSVNNDSKKALDLCLLMDCTGSMSSWIERSKSQLKAIIDS